MPQDDIGANDIAAVFQKKMKARMAEARKRKGSETGLHGGSVTNWTQYRIDHPEPSFTYWREYYMFCQLLFVISILACIGWLVRCTERRHKADLERKAELERHAQDSLEMVELAPVEETEVAAGVLGVRQHLNRLRLDEYAEDFEQHGYDYWPEILRLSQDRFDKLVKLTKMSPNHIDRLREALASQRKERGIQRATGTETKDVDEQCVLM